MEELSCLLFLLYKVRPISDIPASLNTRTVIMRDSEIHVGVRATAWHCELEVWIAVRSQFCLKNMCRRVRREPQKLQLESARYLAHQSYQRGQILSSIVVYNSPQCVSVYHGDCCEESTRTNCRWTLAAMRMDALLFEAQRTGL